MSAVLSRSPRLSVSTWSLHRTLGRPAFYGPAHASIPADTHGRGRLTLLELPEQLAAAEITTLEICHFHLPTRDAGYLAELRAALKSAGIELFSLLIDDGDLTNPETAERDQAWIAGWLETAGLLGARCARVIAGKAPPSTEGIIASAAALSVLARHADEYGLRLMTENWFGLLGSPAEVHNLFDRLEDRVGLCLDFGNWGGPNKYADLASIAPLAESCHAKAHFSAPGVMDSEDFTRCLELTRVAQFAGPYTLIYDGPDENEWVGIAIEYAAVLPFVAQ